MSSWEDGKQATEKRLFSEEDESTVAPSVLSRGDSSASVGTTGSDVRDALSRGVTSPTELQMIEEEALIVANQAGEADQAAGVNRQETQEVDAAEMETLAEELSQLLQKPAHADTEVPEASGRASTPPGSKVSACEDALSPGWFRSPKRPDPLTEEINEHWAYRRGKSTEALDLPQQASSAAAEQIRARSMDTQQDGSQHQQTPWHSQQTPGSYMDTQQDGHNLQIVPVHPQQTPGMDTQQDGHEHRQTPVHPQQTSSMDTQQDGNSRQHAELADTQQDGDEHQQTPAYLQQIPGMDTQQDGREHQQTPVPPQQTAGMDTQQDGRKHQQMPVPPQQTAGMPEASADSNPSAANSWHGHPAGQGSP